MLYLLYVYFIGVIIIITNGVITPCFDLYRLSSRYSKRKEAFRLLWCILNALWFLLFLFTGCWCLVTVAFIITIIRFKQIII